MTFGKKEGSKLMDTKELIEQLMSNRLLRDAKEIQTFVATLDTLAAAPDIGSHELDDLHLVLDDRTEEPGVMFDLIHFLEAFDVKQQLDAFVRVLPELSTTSPEWAQIINCRILNSDEAREVYAEILSACNTDSKSTARSLLAIVAETKPEPLSSYAASVLAKIGSF